MAIKEEVKRQGKTNRINYSQVNTELTYLRKVETQLRDYLSFLDRVKSNLSQPKK